MNKSYAATGGAIAIACLPMTSFAVAQLDVKLGAGAEYHDNALQTETDKRSDYARVVNVGLAFHNQERNLPIDIDYVVENRDFEHDLQDDETTLTGNSSLVWAALPKTLDFRLGNQSSSQVLDRRGTDVSNNREQRTITTAGANLYGHLGAVDTLVLSPSFTDVQVAGTTGDDSEHATLGAGWEHRFSTVSSLQFSVAHSSVDAESSVNDYDLDTATLGFVTRLSRLTYSLSAGGNRIKRDEEDDVSGAMAEVSAEYTGGDFSWGLSYVNRLTDSSLGLEGFTVSNGLGGGVGGGGSVSGSGAGGGIDGGDGNIGEFDILRSREADLHAAYRFGSASTLSGRIGSLDYDYEDTLRDERDYSAELRYGYIVNTRWQLDFGGTYRTADFLDDPNDLEQNDTVVDASVTYRFTPQFSVNMRVGREERDIKRNEDANNANVEEGDYVDAFAILMLNYVVY